MLRSGHGLCEGINPTPFETSRNFDPSANSSDRGPAAAEDFIDLGLELPAARVDVDAAAHARRCRYPVLCQYVHEHLPRRGLGSWEVRSEGWELGLESGVEVALVSFAIYPCSMNRCIYV